MLAHPTARSADEPGPGIDMKELIDDLAKRVNDKELYGYVVLDAATKDDASFRLPAAKPHLEPVEHV